MLAALAKIGAPGANKALAEIWNAENESHALDAVRAFESGYEAKFSKAVAKITDDVDGLLAFYDYPAEHWVHLRTTNPIESTFATVRNRSKTTKDPGSRAAGIAMAFKLIEAAQSRWRAVNAPHLVALVGAGAKFDVGRFVERPDDQAVETAARGPSDAVRSAVTSQRCRAAPRPAQGLGFRRSRRVETGREGANSMAVKPNIVFVLADNVGWGDFGCYGGDTATPRIDEVAAEGIRFTNYSVESQCTPTRSAILTGRQSVFHES